MEGIVYPRILSFLQNKTDLKPTLLEWERNYSYICRCKIFTTLLRIGIRIPTTLRPLDLRKIRFMTRVILYYIQWA
jgi:hypothetical protein